MIVGRGLHIALTDAELRELYASDDVVAHVGGYLEELKFGTPDTCETDKAWRYIHEALNSSRDVADRSGRPLKRPRFVLWRYERYAICGIDTLLDQEDYFIGGSRPSDVKIIAISLAGISTDEMRARLWRLYADLPDFDEPAEIADYVLQWYPQLVGFYRGAAEGRKHVIFTVD